MVGLSLWVASLNWLELLSQNNCLPVAHLSVMIVHVLWRELAVVKRERHFILEEMGIGCCRRSLLDYLI